MKKVLKKPQEKEKMKHTKKKVVGKDQCTESKGERAASRRHKRCGDGAVNFH